MISLDTRSSNHGDNEQDTLTSSAQGSPVSCAPWETTQTFRSDITKKKQLFKTKTQLHNKSTQFMGLSLLCFPPSFCFSFLSVIPCFLSCSFSFSAFAPLLSHTLSGSRTHTCVPCSSTCRWARLSTHRHQGTTLCVTSVLSRPLWRCGHRMCVIAKRLGRMRAFLERPHI